jgi:hypothetical protein
MRAEPPLEGGLSAECLRSGESAASAVDLILGLGGLSGAASSLRGDRVRSSLLPEAADWADRWSDPLRERAEGRLCALEVLPQYTHSSLAPLMQYCECYFLISRIISHRDKHHGTPALQACHNRLTN